MEKPNILIIKLGAIGDVVRTTPLLRVLDGNIIWVTGAESEPLLPEKTSLKKTTNLDPSNFESMEFDLVLSLDDDIEAANLASKVKAKNIVGSILDERGEISYTSSSAEWFDMGLISNFGKEKADELKLKNTKTYQEILFSMIGRKFNGEEYEMRPPDACLHENIKIGIEKRAGARWPMKRWNQYDGVFHALINEGYDVVFFEDRHHIQDYVNDINQCDVILTGDTLGMHIALALKKKIVALFICTSSAEIYDYDRLIKMTSPLLSQIFYRKDYVADAVNTIKFEDVYSAVKSQINKVHYR
jgi:heptosyltransferase-2